MGLEKWYLSSGKQLDNIYQEPQKYPPPEKINTPKYRKLYLGKDVQRPKVGTGSIHHQQVPLTQDTGEFHAFH